MSRLNTTRKPELLHDCHQNVTYEGAYQAILNLPYDSLTRLMDATTHVKSWCKHHLLTQLSFKL